MNDRRFTLRMLGVVMESVNFTPKELRKTMWTAASILFVAIVLWRLPEIIQALR